MLKFRIIPLILVDGPNTVKGELFNNWRRIGTLPSSVNVYNSRDVDELVVIDSRASRTREVFNARILETAIGRMSVPLTVGGGISTLKQAADLIESGADKVIVSTSVVENPQLLKDVAQRFGTQAVVASIDVKRGTEGDYCAFIKGGSEPVSKTPKSIACQAEDLGAGEVVVNSISRDGTMSGFDLEILNDIAEAVGIPILAAGGAGSTADFVQLAKLSDASGGIASSIFCFTETTPEDIRRAVGESGIPTRKSLPNPVRSNSSSY